MAVPPSTWRLWKFRDLLATFFFSLGLFPSPSGLRPRRRFLGLRYGCSRVGSLLGAEGKDLL